MKVLAVVALAGCASSSPSPAVCGGGWAPLSTEHAHVAAPDLEARDATTITAVRIAGIDAALAVTLRRELATKPGDLLVDAPLADDLRRLWKLGVIEDARVTLEGDAVTFVLTPRPTITHVVRKGGDALAQSRFRQLASTPFEPSRIRRMAAALEESYLRAGRLDARVEARHRVHAGGVDVCIATNPGKRITIASLEFPGAKAVPGTKLRQVLRGKEANVNRVGGTFDESALAADEIYLQLELWERGFADARVGVPIVKRRRGKLDVAIPIEEGPRYRIGTVTSPIPVPLQTGAVFSRTSIVTARDQLQKLLGVDVSPATHVDREAMTVDVTFEVNWRWPWDALRFWSWHSP